MIQSTINPFLHFITFATSYTFDSVFGANRNMDVYIMGDSNGEQFAVSEMNIQSICCESSSPTLSPSLIPSDSPTSYPTNAPIALHANSSNQQVTITLTFQRVLNPNDTDEIVLILRNITHESTENMTCNAQLLDFEIIFVENANMTIINASLSVCDGFTRYELLNSLQKQFVQTINNETDLQITQNETSIQILSFDESTNIQSTFTVIADDIENAEHDGAQSVAIEDVVFMWMIRVVILELVLSCLLTIIILIIKWKTKKLKVLQDEIKRSVNNMRRDGEADGDESVTDEKHSNIQKCTIDLHGEAEQNNDVVVMNIVDSESKTEVTKQSEAHPNTIDESNMSSLENSNHTLISDEDRCIMKILKTKPVMAGNGVGLEKKVMDKNGVWVHRKNTSDHSLYPSIPETSKSMTKLIKNITVSETIESSQYVKERRPHAFI